MYYTALANVKRTAVKMSNPQNLKVIKKLYIYKNSRFLHKKFVKLRYRQNFMLQSKIDTLKKGG